MIEVPPQVILMDQTLDRARCRAFGEGLRHQEFATAVGHVTPDPAVQTLAVLPEDVEWPVISLHHTFRTPASTRIA
jgi:hypothetical protein